MFTVVAALTIAAAANADDVPRLPTVATLERVPLPKTIAKPVVIVDALEGLVEVRVGRDAAGFAGRLAAAGSRICPRVRPVDAGVVVMHCRTRQLDAFLTEQKGKTFLEIQELRGLPWRGEANEVFYHYDPAALKFGGACPGTTVLSRAECALGEGRLTEAAVDFRAGLTADGKSLAALRLGDIALLTNDPGTAAGWYHMAGASGPFGRMAAAKLCELGGMCLGHSRTSSFDTVGLPEPLRSEMALRAARLSLFRGRVEESMNLLYESIPPRGTAGACVEVGLLFCRTLILHALTRLDKEGGLRALETYLVLPDRMEGPLWYELLRAAADKAAFLGAPLFAANLLAAHTALVREPRTADHLLRAAELYLIGKDLARARVVYEYAESRLGRKKMPGPGWATVTREVRRAYSDESQSVIPAHELALTEGIRDLAEAYAAMARVRLGGTP